MRCYQQVDWRDCSPICTERKTGLVETLPPKRIPYAVTSQGVVWEVCDCKVTDGVETVELPGRGLLFPTASCVDEWGRIARLDQSQINRSVVLGKRVWVPLGFSPGPVGTVPSEEGSALGRRDFTPSEEGSCPNPHTGLLVPDQTEIVNDAPTIPLPLLRTAKTRYFARVIVGVGVAVGSCIGFAALIAAMTTL